MRCSSTGCASTSAPIWRCWGTPMSVSFTAGIGENDAAVRWDALAGMEELGIILHEERNLSPERAARRISADDSRITVLAVPTNEELAIARDCVQLVAGL